MISRCCLLFGFVIETVLQFDLFYLLLLVRTKERSRRLLETFTWSVELDLSEFMGGNLRESRDSILIPGGPIQFRVDS